MIDTGSETAQITTRPETQPSHTRTARVATQLVTKFLTNTANILTSARTRHYREIKSSEEKETTTN